MAKNDQDKVGPDSAGQSPDKEKGSTMEDVKAASDPKKVQERLGFGLRSMYRSVLEEPLPDDLAALLDQLEAKDKGSDENGDSSG